MCGGESHSEACFAAGDGGVADGRDQETLLGKVGSEFHSAGFVSDD